MDDLLAQFEFPLLVEALLNKYGALPDGWAEEMQTSTGTEEIKEEEEQEERGGEGVVSSSTEAGNVAASPLVLTSLPPSKHLSAAAAAELAAAPRRFSTADSSEDDEAAGELHVSPGMTKLALTRSHAKSRDGPNAALLHQQLVAFYETREPAKTQVAKRLLTNHSLAELKRALLAKYGAVPVGWEHINDSTPNHSPGGSTSSSACSSPTWKDRVLAQSSN